MRSSVSLRTARTVTNTSGVPLELSFFELDGELVTAVSLRRGGSLGTTAAPWDFTGDATREHAHKIPIPTIDRSRIEANVLYLGRVSFWRIPLDRLHRDLARRQRDEIEVSPTATSTTGWLPSPRSDKRGAVNVKGDRFSRLTPPPRIATVEAMPSKPKRRRASSRPPSLLILHLDADKLRRDRLHLGEQAAFIAGLAAVGLDAEVTIADVTDRDNLHRTLSDLVVGKRSFDVVVAIGHSNSTGIRIASNAFAEWSAFGDYLKPLRPRRLVLIACQAGQWPGAVALFGRLRELRRIYASPVNATKDLASFMLALVPHVVAIKVPKKKHLRWMQAAALALTGRQVRMWTRADAREPDGVLFDFAAKLFDRDLQKVPSILRQLFSG